MAVKKKGLGKGLDSLIPEKSNKQKSRLKKRGSLSQVRVFK